MKVLRQSKIVEIVSNRDVETQEELAELLTKAGFAVTQATVSRDIRELKLTKMASESGRQKYVIMSQADNSVQTNGKYSRILKDAVVSVDAAQNLIVIKTNAGMAMAVAAAVDAMHLSEIVGSLAGDDTVFCAVRTLEGTRKTMQQILENV